MINNPGATERNFRTVERHRSPPKLLAALWLVMLQSFASAELMMEKEAA